MDRNNPLGSASTDQSMQPQLLPVGSSKVSPQQQQQQQNPNAQQNPATDGGSISDEVVLQYLEKKGLGSAAIELKQLLQKQTKTSPPSTASGVPPKHSLDLEKEEGLAKNRRTMLAQATGGGFGYDVDGAAFMLGWKIPGGADSTAAGSEPRPMGQQEAQLYMQGFSRLQTWILSLPDDPPVTAASDKNGTSSTSTLSTLVKNQCLDAPQDLVSAADEMSNQPPSASAGMPSVKPELQAVAFCLLVLTYFELFECNQDTMAKTLLETFREIHAPSYPKEFQDLVQFKSTESYLGIVRCNQRVADCASAIKEITAEIEKKKREGNASPTSKKRKAGASDAAGGGGSNGGDTDASSASGTDKTITQLEQRVLDIKKNSQKALSKVAHLPFFRQVKSQHRWYLRLSATSYGLLTAFLSSSLHPSLHQMNHLLLTKCEVKVEFRDPLPYTPPVEPFVPDVTMSISADDVASHDVAALKDDSSGVASAVKVGDSEVRWASALAPTLRRAEEGEDADTITWKTETPELPFPRYYLDENMEYDTQEQADRAKRSVEFNRALLIHGFRRLEALEIRQEYEVGMRSHDPSKKELHAKPADAAGKNKDDHGGGAQPASLPSDAYANPLEPSILLTTLCSSAGGGPSWEEAGIGVTCARVSPPDGRRVAAGCDDAAVRIWSMFPSSASDRERKQNDEVDKDGDVEEEDAVKESSIVLLGHKNGFPVFDVDWNRDGRTLLSAGGDGSVRLWDTVAVGTYGKTTAVKRKTGASGVTSSKVAPTSRGDAIVPGLRSEPAAEVNGAALAVYRGHSPSTPVWAVAGAPSGYYFCSAGSDNTARIWTTDRTSPVRILVGHASPSVHCVTWHPNCNYVLTGSEDKTVRMWDVQSGQTVRLLAGCSTGVNVVKVSPSGKYAAGADYSGTVSIWELGSGRKINEFRSRSGNMVNSLAYSACGTALATGGDDCTVRIWNVRGAANHMANPDFAKSQGWGQTVTSLNHGERPGTKVPLKSFCTKRTMILDLRFTNRNLLLSVGKYIEPVSVGSAVVERN